MNDIIYMYYRLYLRLYSIPNYLLNPVFKTHPKGTIVAIDQQLIFSVR